MKSKVTIIIGSVLVALSLGVVSSFAQPTESGTINSLNNSNVRGTYRFETVDSANTRVTVNVQGLSPNSVHAGHFHEGTCNNIGPITLSLNDIRADSEGRGTMTTTISSSLQNLYSGRFLLSYHESAGDESQSIACATIPQKTISAPDQSTPRPTPTLRPSLQNPPSTGMGGSQ